MSQMGDNSVPSEKRVSQYEALMKKFSESHKEQCRSLSVDIPKTLRSVKQLPTGSQYEGTWDVLGMSGAGIYTFPNGVIYQGEFDDGEFHGHGEMIYPTGELIKTKYEHGRIVERTLVFSDGLEYSDEDWMYCRMPDRRYTIEYDEGLKPALASHKTADVPTREIPLGHYDTGDGFYDPETKMIYKADDLTALVRWPSNEEQAWIVENCRTNPCTEQGPRSDLYEQWTYPDVNPPFIPDPPCKSRTTTFTDDEYEEDDLGSNASDAFIEDWHMYLKENSDIMRHIKFSPMPAAEVELMSVVHEDLADNKT